MKAIEAKLHSSRGESLVETLAAILIATLSVGLLMGGVAVSAHLERQADQTDTSFYTTLQQAEERFTPVTEGVNPSPKVSITSGGTSIDLPVQVYGGTGLWSYGLNRSDTEGGVTS